MRVDPASFAIAIPAARCSSQPWKTFSQSPRLSNPAAALLPRNYVRCTADKGPGDFMGGAFALSWQRAQERGWHCAELAGDHTAVGTEEAAALLLHLLAGWMA